MGYVDTLRAELITLKAKEVYFQALHSGPYWQYLDLAERILLRSESIDRTRRIAQIEETLNRLDEGQVRLASARFS